MFNASSACLQAARFVRPVDKDFAQKLLDKAQEYKDKVEVDEDLEKEVNEFEEEIRKGL